MTGVENFLEHGAIGVDHSFPRVVLPANPLFLCHYRMLALVRRAGSVATKIRPQHALLHRRVATSKVAVSAASAVDRMLHTLSTSRRPPSSTPNPLQALSVWCGPGQRRTYYGSAPPSYGDRRSKALETAALQDPLDFDKLAEYLAVSACLWVFVSAGFICSLV
jgi:hypothetical protein